jgi:hypothetical protein
VTTLHAVEVTCASCGGISTQTEVGSTYVAGSPDLDTRPPELQRSTMEYWVQACPHCTYVAPDIARATPDALDIVGGIVYRSQWQDGELPALARRFLCWALIQETTGDAVGAGWSSVHAAWACDDAANTAAAARCRRRALELFLSAKDRGESFVRGPYAEYALLADLWRRTGEFDRALETCEQGLAAIKRGRRRRKKTDTGEVEVIEGVLRFERVLAEKQDEAVHTVGEALGERQEP